MAFHYVLLAYGEKASMKRINRKEVGKRIRDIRGDRSQTVFAKMIFEGRVKKRQDYVSRYELGIRIPKPEILIRIAEIGQTTVDFLLMGDPYSHW